MTIHDPLETPAQIHNDKAELSARRAVFQGRARIGRMASKLFNHAEPGPLETSRILTADADLAARLIAVANTVRRGAGIAATSLEGATVRLGSSRTRAWALACEIGDLVASICNDAMSFTEFWRLSLWRGCLAQSLAMNVDPRIAAEAFLVGALQDIAVPLLRAENPIAYRRIMRICTGAPQRQAMLEWQATGANHLHIGRGMLEGWRLPTSVTAAVGRHHSRPPATTMVDGSSRLWQIAYVVGGIPTGSGGVAGDPSWERFMSSAFHMVGPSLTAWLNQAAEEYHDALGLFEPITDAAPIDGLIESAAAFLNVAPPKSADRITDQPPSADRMSPPVGRDRLVSRSWDASTIAAVQVS